MNPIESLNSKINLDSQGRIIFTLPPSPAATRLAVDHQPEAKELSFKEFYYECKRAGLIAPCQFL